MSTLPVGSQGLTASRLGLGCMGMTSGLYTEKGVVVDETESEVVLTRALELGCNFLDSSDAYGPHLNEEFLGKAMKGRREKFVVATKFGVTFEGGRQTVRGDPQHVRASCEASLKRLQTSYIDLCACCNTPLIGAEELVKEGKVKHLGISEASAQEIERAHAIHPISAVQQEWSCWTRDAEETIIPTCRRLGIAIVAYSPLGRGFLTGAITGTDHLDDSDLRLTSVPRWQKDNLTKNLALVEEVQQIAAEKGCTPGQLALAWLLHQGADVFPIPGTKRVKYLEENMGALNVRLTKEDMGRVEAVFHGKVHGGRVIPERLGNTYEGGA